MGKMATNITPSRAVCSEVRSNPWFKEELARMKADFISSGESKLNPSEYTIDVWQKYLFSVAKKCRRTYSIALTVSFFFPKKKRINWAKQMISNISYPDK